MTACAASSTPADGKLFAVDKYKGDHDDVDHNNTSV